MCNCFTNATHPKVSRKGLQPRAPIIPFREMDLEGGYRVEWLDFAVTLAFQWWNPTTRDNLVKVAAPRYQPGMPEEEQYRVYGHIMSAKMACEAQDTIPGKGKNGKDYLAVSIHFHDKTDVGMVGTMFPWCTKVGRVGSKFLLFTTSHTISYVTCQYANFPSAWQCVWCGVVQTRSDCERCTSTRHETCSWQAIQAS